ncbi:MAG: hypothetical protein U0X20_21955 [Caldilineaceae bacterium]
MTTKTMQGNVERLLALLSAVDKVAATWRAQQAAPLESAGVPSLDGEPMSAETEEEQAGVVLDLLVGELLTALLDVREPKELIGAILARREAKGLALLVDVTPAHILLGGRR